MSLHVILVRPELFHGSGADPGPCTILDVVPRAPLPLGRTTLLLPPEALLATSVRGADGTFHPALSSPVPFDCGTWDSAARERKRRSWDRLGLAEAVVPLICLHRTGDGTIRAFHRINAGPAGTLYTALPPPAGAPPLRDLAAAAATVRAWSATARDIFNPGMSHTRWNREIELERKFTFAPRADDPEAAPVDTFRLMRALHAELRAGAWPGFIPEFNEEFHIWDYESAMFEVTAPQEAQGYVAFIPQFDGRVTVKYKAFTEECERRREDIASDVVLDPADFREAAAHLSRGTVAPLPGFRRVRFDCDIESLDTGNAFAILFDICRTTEDATGLLSQCEVEYLRSRSIAPVEGVEREFATLCDFTRDFLARHGAMAAEGYRSKLSFVRDVAAARARARGAA